jgi:hypothetical protein
VGTLSIHSAQEEVEAVAKVKGKGSSVLIRSTFLMDGSFYPAGHDHTKTKAWLVLVINEQDDKFSDPRTADGKDSAKIAKAKDDFKKSNKTHYWFDDFKDAEKKYYELAGSVCGVLLKAAEELESGKQMKGKK